VILGADSCIHHAVVLGELVIVRLSMESQLKIKIEHAFGLLVNKWTIFKKTIDINLTWISSGTSYYITSALMKEKRSGLSLIFSMKQSECIKHHISSI